MKTFNSERFLAIVALAVVGFCFYREINKALDKKKVMEMKDQEVAAASKQSVSK